MKKRIVALFLCVFMALSVFSLTSFATDGSKQIIILYENDVHCSVEGYSKLSALKKELASSGAYVGVVSSGDYIQGGSLGVISKGEYIVKLMNLVGYDALTLGNHEFDYHLTRLDELANMMNTKPVCCNFKKISDANSYFEPYSIVSYGETDIAYIGLTTPATITSSSPAQFKDENGEYIYSFNADKLGELFQESIDSAKAEGADYVIALTHIGDAAADAIPGFGNIKDLIGATEGLDAVLDAHSHSVIEGERVKDKSGKEVLLSSTGTKFEHIGKLTIKDGMLTSELIKTEEYEKTDAEVDAYLDKINEEYSKLGEREIAYSEVDLITADKDGNRLIRKQETNLGDICAEAFRSAVDANIGFLSGGGIRADIPAGKITFNDILSVFPFNNTIVLAEIDGHAIRDMLEMSLIEWPEECSFPHVSGITFSVNKAIPSSVVLDENEEFVSVDGQYRVYNIKVLNRTTGKYEALDLDGKYTVASHNYYLLECGSGMTMFKDAKILDDTGMLDVEALERHLVEDLGGVVGEEYSEASINITFTDGEALDTPKVSPLYIALGVTAVAAIAVITVVVINIKNKKEETV